MENYYEAYKLLIIVTVLNGIYLKSIEKIFGDKWYIKALKLIFIMPGVSLVVYFVAAAKFIFIDEGQLSTKIYGFVVLIFAFSALHTFLSFYLRASEHERIFELWDSLFQEELFSKDRQELLNKNRNFTIKWLMGFGGPSFLCGIVYCIATYFNPEKKMPHPTGIPYRNASPDFELVATLDLFAAMSGFSLLIIFDSMTMAVLSQEEAQFIHLKRSLSRIVEVIYVTDSGEVYLKNEENSGIEIVNASNSWKVQKVFEKADENLQIWISHHKQILRLHDEVQRIFSGSFSVKYLIFMLIICFCCFLIITGVMDLKDIVMTTIFCFNLYATFYLNIRYADSTTETAESLFGDAFSESWYLFPKKLTTAFHIILMRCRRPVQYKMLLIYPLNPRSFLKILTTSYTFFTFLLQVNMSKH